MIAAIPYQTFPDLLSIGGFQLRTFGLMVGLGVLLGAWVAASYCETFGIDREDTYQLATRLVVFGVVGARLTWVASHWDQIDSPIDIIAVWEGGLQFSGGFVAAVAAGFPTFRKWSRLTRWRVIDGYAMGLTIGLAFGRVGCTSVGEHFGSTWGASWFPLMVRYTRNPLPGELREPYLGDPSRPVLEGTVFHQTAIYEMLWLLVLFVVLWRLLHRRPPVTPATGIGLFCIVYAPLRFMSDFIRINDNTVLGLTGAQYLMAVVTMAGVWLLFRVRPQNAVLVLAETEAAELAEAQGPADSDTDAGTVPDTDADTAPDADTDAGSLEAADISSDSGSDTGPAPDPAEDVTPNS